MKNLPNPEDQISYRCQACGELYDERKDAVRCFEKHTRRLGDMIERVVDFDKEMEAHE